MFGAWQREDAILVVQRMQRVLVWALDKDSLTHSMTLLSSPKANTALSLIRASLRKTQAPPHTPICVLPKGDKKTQKQIVRGRQGKSSENEEVFFFFLTNKCAEKCRRPSRPVKPISINSTGTQTLLYNSGEEVDAGSAGLALPTLPPPFNRGVLSETDSCWKAAKAFIRFVCVSPAFKSRYGTTKAYSPLGRGAFAD